jgi:large subunit ribosomal protein L17
MRHGQKGRKLGRTASHKRAMLNNMATSLFQHGTIRTTLPKAKELRGVAERLITFAKRGDLSARRQVLRRIQNKVIVSKLFDEIGPSFSDRAGGYTRILKLGPRRGDSTELCMIQLVGDEVRSETAESASAPAAVESPSETVEATSEAKPEATADTLDVDETEAKKDA